MLSERKPNRVAFIISGPSGTGKSTICKRILEEDSTLVFSISCTTRSPRLGEKDKKDYHFISLDVFQQHIEKGELLEYAKVHECFYGTLQKEIEVQFLHGNDVLLDIDVQGAIQIQEAIGTKPFGLCFVYLFLLPPSFAELEKRLILRGTESEMVMRKRLKRARKEIEFLQRYDYVIVNEEKGKAVDDIRSIINAERLRVLRHEKSL